jgi:hypothetical protein
MNFLKISALVMLSATLYAVTPFASFDKNKDGTISEEEFYTTQADNMSKRAEDGRMMRNAPNAPAFSDIDADADGKITESELKDFQYNRVLNNRGKGPNKGPNN